MVILEKSNLLVDPGSEIYTKRTFSRNRYQSNVLNSFGHPVPLVNGKMQLKGDAAKAVVLKNSFSREADTIVFDIKSAYEVPGLTKLTRTFIYSRKRKGSLVVIDEFAFDSPKQFGNAFITFSKYHKDKKGWITVHEGDKSVKILLDAGGKAFQINEEVLKEDLPIKKYPLRIGIDLRKPAKTGFIKLTISPEKS
jgi:hypothetical protein